MEFRTKEMVRRMRGSHAEEGNGQEGFNFFDFVDLLLAAIGGMEEAKAAAGTHGEQCINTRIHTKAHDSDSEAANLNLKLEKRKKKKVTIKLRNENQEEEKMTAE